MDAMDIHFYEEASASANSATWHLAIESEALHSGKQDLGLRRITEELTCSSVQVVLSTKGDVRLDQPKVQGQIGCEGISTRI